MDLLRDSSAGSSMGLMDFMMSGTSGQNDGSLMGSAALMSSDLIRQSKTSSGEVTGVTLGLGISHINEEYEEHDEEDLIYPSLLDASELLDDPEWSDGPYDPEWANILYDAAYGRLPPGFTVRNDGISYTSGGKRQTILPSMDPMIAAKDMITFFKTAGGVRTTMDIEAERVSLLEARNQQEEEFRSLSWSKMKSAAKYEAVSYYADRLVDKMKLNSKQRSNLETVINMGLNTGAIRDSDIVFTKGEINDIESVVYNGTRFTLTSEARSRIKLPVIKDVCPDSVYFSKYGKPTELPNRKFGGFLGEWNKLNRNIHKIVVVANTGRVTASSSSYNDESVPVYEWTDEVIDGLKPQKFAYNPDNVLLSPRPITFSETIRGIGSGALSIPVTPHQAPSTPSTMTFSFV